MFAIIVNPVSGTHANETLIQELIELIEARGHRAKIFATEWKGDATNKARLALHPFCSLPVSKQFPGSQNFPYLPVCDPPYGGSDCRSAFHILLGSVRRCDHSPR